jgi:hypothetical protein
MIAVTPTTGLDVKSGWHEIAGEMQTSCIMVLAATFGVQEYELRTQIEGSLRVVYEQSAENRSVRHGIHLKRVFWNERLTAGRSYSFVDLGRGAGSQGLLSVDKSGQSFGRAPRHWKTPATPDPVSAGRVRARK